MTRNRYNRIPQSTPDTSRGKEQKDEKYQLELPTVETLPWNYMYQYKINGRVGGLTPCTQSCH